VALLKTMQIENRLHIQFVPRICFDDGVNVT